MKRSVLAWIGLGGLGLVFALVFAQVLEMRFSDGDVYPYYATYRNDPLGGSAFYEALQQMEEYEVSRNVTAMTIMKGLDRDTALLLTGIPRSSFYDLRAKDSSPVLRAVEDQGTRLIMTLNPELVPEFFSPAKSEEEEDWIDRRRKLQEKRNRERKEKEEQKDSGDDSEPKKEGSVDDEEEEDFEKEMEEAIGRALYKIIEVKIADVEEFEKPEEGWETEPVDSIAETGPPLATPIWFSQYNFETESDEWKVVLTVDDKPVVVERKLGKGSVVLASDSYFISNEALHNGADIEFLTWLLGGKSKVIFDETIHGSVETGGAMKLIRRYRFHGFFFGMLIFVGLWAWRSASFLAPGDESVERGLVGGEGTVAGEEAGSGFTGLLRRSIPAKELVKKCIHIFRSSSHLNLDEKQEGEIANLVNRHELSPKEFNAPDTYRDLTKIIRKR